MSSARHFWNGFLPLVNQPSERRRLRDELLILLQCMTSTTDKNKFKKSDEVRTHIYCIELLRSLLVGSAEFRNTVQNRNFRNRTIP